MYDHGQREVQRGKGSSWLLLVERIGMLRKPAALPSWLATTTQRECLRVLRQGEAGEG
jgi:hypothetical protein